MYVTVIELSTHKHMLLRTPLTTGLLHVIGSSFTTTELSQFQQGVLKYFDHPVLSRYCIDSLPDSRALLTFSTLKNPKIYTYKNKGVRIRYPDASSFSLLVQELELQKSPSHLTCDKKAYIE